MTEVGVIIAVNNKEPYEMPGTLVRLLSQ